MGEEGGRIVVEQDLMGDAALTSTPDTIRGDVTIELQGNDLELKQIEMVTGDDGTAPTLKLDGNGGTLKLDDTSYGIAMDAKDATVEFSNVTIDNVRPLFVANRGDVNTGMTVKFDNVTLNGSYGIYSESCSIEDKNVPVNILIENSHFNVKYMGVNGLMNGLITIKNSDITAGRTCIIARCCNLDLQNVNLTLNTDQGNLQTYSADNWKYGYIGQTWHNYGNASDVAYGALLIGDRNGRGLDNALYYSGAIKVDMDNVNIQVTGNEAKHVAAVYAVSHTISPVTLNYNANCNLNSGAGDFFYYCNSITDYPIIINGVTKTTQWGSF